MLKKQHKLKLKLKQTKPSRPQLIIIVLTVAVVGTAFVYLTQAAGQTANFEPERATLAGTVCPVNDAAASGGSAVQFGSSCNVRTIPANIASGATCTTSLPDVSYQIWDWIESLPSGVTAKLGANRCYRVERFIAISGRSNFTLDGNGSKLQALTDGCDSQDPNPSDDNVRFDQCRFTSPRVDRSGKPDPDWPQDRKRILIQGARNVTVKNIKLDGGHTNPGPDGTYDAKLAFQHGIDFRESNQNVTVENVEIDRVWGDFMYFGREVGKVLKDIYA